MKNLSMSVCLSLILMSAGLTQSFAADYVSGPFEKSRAYSTAVVTDGGHMVFLAGEGGNRDANGKDISNDLDAQIDLIFSNFSKTLKKVGGTNANITTMTVFIKDEKDGDRFVKLRKKYFPDGNYPASSLITIKDLAQPGWKIEVEGVAVVGDKCTKGQCVSGN